MSDDKDITGLFDPPLRAEILKAPSSYAWKWKPGQFAYVVSYTTSPVDLVDKIVGVERQLARAGDLTFGVAKKQDLTTGTYFFSPDAVRLTRAPTALISALSDDEKVALDLLMAEYSPHRPHAVPKIARTTLSTLVSNPTRRVYVRAIAALLRSLRAR
jgi:hypothetical protein